MKTGNLTSVLYPSYTCGHCTHSDPIFMSDLWRLRGDGNNADDFGCPSPTFSFVHLHGTLMYLAWGLLLPLGALLARYYRWTWPCWFILHVICQVRGGGRERGRGKVQGRERGRVVREGDRAVLVWDTCVFIDFSFPPPSLPPSLSLLSQSCIPSPHPGGMCMEPKNPHCEENQQRNLTLHTNSPKLS